MALRPCRTDRSMNSLCGSHLLGAGLRPRPASELAGAAGSVVDPLAGLAGAAAGSVVDRLAGLAGAAAGSVVDPLAGFGRCRPRGPRTAIPAALRYWLAVSRRILVSCSIRRSDQPSRPSASTVCFFSSRKTFTPGGGPRPAASRQRPGAVATTGRFSGVHHWPVLGVHRGSSAQDEATRNVAGRVERRIDRTLIDVTDLVTFGAVDHGFADFRHPIQQPLIEIRAGAVVGSTLLNPFERQVALRRVVAWVAGWIRQRVCWIEDGARVVEAGHQIGKTIRSDDIKEAVGEVVSGGVVALRDQIVLVFQVVALPGQRAQLMRQERLFIPAKCR